MSIQDFQNVCPPDIWRKFTNKIEKKEFTQKTTWNIFNDVTATCSPPSASLKSWKPPTNDKSISTVVPAKISSSRYVDKIMSKHGGKLSDESELSAMLDEAIAANEKAVNDLKKGKKKAKDALIGFVMRKTRGKADPEVLGRLLKARFPDLEL